MIYSVRIFTAISIACLTGFYFQRAWGLEHGNDYSARDRLFGLDRKDKVIHLGFFPLVLPIGLCIIFAGFIAKLGWHDGLFSFFRLSVDLLLTMSLYYTALLLLMPLLRRRISARACATAWLFPAFLYYVGYSFLVIRPHVVLYFPNRLLNRLIPVWFAGFVLFFGTAVLSHLYFRRKVMRTSHAERDASVLRIWQQESERLGFKTPIRLVRWEQAKTPFSMADTKRSRMTVLPDCPYKEQELRLIFRHELHHLQRNDTDAGIFLSFLRALFWFHPLVWIALREASRDIELSCDEIVLDESDDNDRRLYADLLLNTAGERHGFTTCLSADARSLRYRLRHVMQKRTCRTGTWTLMVLLFTCLMCHGIFALSDERTTLGEVFPLESMDFCLYETAGELSYSDTELTNESRNALLSSLKALPVEHLSGGRRADIASQSPRLYLSSQDMSLCMWLCDGSIVIYDLDNIDLNHSTVYYIRGDIDWEKIEACFTQHAPSIVLKNLVLTCTS